MMGSYTSFQLGIDLLPVGITITLSTSSALSRNGIAPVAGQVTIRGGHISQTGLHGIDFEVNNDAAANSVIGVVDGLTFVEWVTCRPLTVRLRRRGRWVLNATKPSMLVQNLTGDVLRT